MKIPLGKTKYLFIPPYYRLFWWRIWWIYEYGLKRSSTLLPMFGRIIREYSFYLQGNLCGSFPFVGIFIKQYGNAGVILFYPYTKQKQAFIMISTPKKGVNVYVAEHILPDFLDNIEGFLLEKFL